MPEIDDLRATDTLFDALSAGVAVDTDDQVVAALAALARFAREGAGVGSPGRVGVGDASPVDRRLAIRSLAAGVAAVAVVCTGGISAAVTGNPLEPVRIVLDQMIPNRPEKASPPSAGETEYATDLSAIVFKIDQARMRLLEQPARAERLRRTPDPLADPLEAVIADVEIAEDISEVPAEDESIRLDAESDGSAPATGDDVESAQEGSQPADEAPLSESGPATPTAAADNPVRPDEATGRPTGTDDVTEGDDATDADATDNAVEGDGTTVSSPPSGVSVPDGPGVEADRVRSDVAGHRPDRADDTESDDPASAHVRGISSDDQERVARAAQVLAGLLIGRR